MAKRLLNDFVVISGLALYLSGPEQVRKMAKAWCPHVTASNRKILKTIISCNDEQLWETLELAVTNYLDIVNPL